MMVRYGILKIFVSDPSSKSRGCYTHLLVKISFVVSYVTFLWYALKNWIIIISFELRNADHSQNLDALSLKF